MSLYNNLVTGFGELITHLLKITPASKSGLLFVPAVVATGLGFSALGALTFFSFFGFFSEDFFFGAIVSCLTLRDFCPQRHRDSHNTNRFSHSGRLLAIRIE